MPVVTLLGCTDRWVRQQVGGRPWGKELERAKGSEALVAVFLSRVNVYGTGSALVSFSNRMLRFNEVKQLSNVNKPMTPSDMAEHPQSTSNPAVRVTTFVLMGKGSARCGFTEGRQRRGKAKVV